MTGPAMSAWFAGGGPIDLVLAIIALEFVVLLARAAPGGRGRRAVDLGLALAPGACILMALRAALTGEAWGVVAFWLAASFPVHVADLLRRRLWTR
ncbi:MAG: hypothetical protein NW200_14430 [Hyphomonadaceae bacterium]|nr:hypothetical protein [Hyphomonadaceae bacterium]